MTNSTEQPLLADVRRELRSLGVELREMAAARGELARLESRRSALGEAFGRRVGCRRGDGAHVAAAGRRLDGRSLGRIDRRSPRRLAAGLCGLPVIGLRHRRLSCLAPLPPQFPRPERDARRTAGRRPLAERKKRGGEGGRATAGHPSSSPVANYGGAGISHYGGADIPVCRASRHFSRQTGMSAPPNSLLVAAAPTNGPFRRLIPAGF